jgi:hypothetical protein
MKKNYIAYMQEYDSNSTFQQKTDKSRKKCIKTIYQQDKENVNPNIINQSAKKKHTKIKPKSYHHLNGTKSNQISRVPTESP